MQESPEFHWPSPVPPPESGYLLFHSSCHRPVLPFDVISAGKNPDRLRLQTPSASGREANQHLRGGLPADAASHVWLAGKALAHTTYVRPQASVIESPMKTTRFASRATCASQIGILAAVSSVRFAQSVSDGFGCGRPASGAFRAPLVTHVQGVAAESHSHLAPRVKSVRRAN